MCFLCSGKPPVIDEPPKNISTTSLADHEPPPGIVGFQFNPLQPSTEEKKQQKKVSEPKPPPKKFSESDEKPSPKKFSPNTTYVRSPSPVLNSDSNDTKDKKSKKTSSPDRKLASSDSETTYASNPMYSTDHFPEWNSDSNKPTTIKMGHESKLPPSPPPEKLKIKSTELSENITRRSPTSDEVTRNTKDKKSRKTSSPDRKLVSSDSETTYPPNPMYSTDNFPEWNSDSNKPTTRKTGHESKLSPSPPPEKLNLKSAELSENTTRRFPTSNEVTRNTTGSPTKARDEQNAKANNTSSNNKKLMWNEKEHTESPYKYAASSLHYQTAISDSERPKYS